MRAVWAALAGTSDADRVVPPTGFTVWLTVFSAGAMAFLAVFALALSLATDRLGTRWAEDLARTSTVRISAPPAQEALQVAAALAVLETTPGVARARALSDAEQEALLAPWFGTDLPLEALPIPRLIEVVEVGEGYDAEGLRARLAAEAPGAVLDDHTRWRRPLIEAADRLRTLGWVSLGLIGATMAVIITLAAQSALAAHAGVIRTLRLVGALDSYIARAFVRRFTLRAGLGAAVGTGLAMGAVAALPEAEVAGGFLTGLGFQGMGWLLPLLIPPLAGLTAFAATRTAALRALRKMP